MHEARDRYGSHGGTAQTPRQADAELLIAGMFHATEAFVPVGVALATVIFVGFIQGLLVFPVAVVAFARLRRRFRTGELQQWVWWMGVFVPSGFPAVFRLGSGVRWYAP